VGVFIGEVVGTGVADGGVVATGVAEGVPVAAMSSTHQTGASKLQLKVSTNHPWKVVWSGVQSSLGLATVPQSPVPPAVQS
jgi:hypothetical protein